MGDISNVNRPAKSEEMVSCSWETISSDWVSINAEVDLDVGVGLKGQITFGGGYEDKHSDYSLKDKIPFVLPKNENTVSYCVKLGNLELCARVTKEAAPPELGIGPFFDVSGSEPFVEVPALKPQKGGDCFCEELKKLYEPIMSEDFFLFPQMKINVFEL